MRLRGIMATEVFIIKKCICCDNILKSTKPDARICKVCSRKTKEPEFRVCGFCDKKFTDNSRSKNKKYCSIRCNTDAGHARHKDNILNGSIEKRKDKRDRKVERKYRYNTDIKFKLSIVLRTRLNAAIKNGQKAGSAIKDLGCSVDLLKSYLESKFLPNMTWDNWGKDGWHIDHIIPISSFDLTNRDELLKACHYTNLQPMWALDNFMKSDKITINNTIYILAGPNGCGKTTLARKLDHKFNIIDYDLYTFNKCIELALSNNNKPHLIVTPIQAKRMKKLLENQGAIVNIIYLQETRETIVERIISREGKITDTIDRRIKRYETLKKKDLFVFSGTQLEVEDWLKSI